MTQQAYQLTVEDVQTKEVVWDSGAVSSSQSSFADYAGAPLHSCTEYRWTVRVWDNHGECAAASADFETAFLCTEDWKAQWAESTLERVPDPDYPIGVSCAPVLFRKSFRLPQQPVRARLYSTAYGVYQIKINDRRPDDREFAPEFTSYAHRLYYQTYDVTALLRSGDNMMEMYVGDGWYFSAFASLLQNTPTQPPAFFFSWNFGMRTAPGGISSATAPKAASCPIFSALTCFMAKSRILRRGGRRLSRWLFGITP